ncbi:glycosyltransferase family 2 protein [Aequorivita echinoideorum]|nr:glycosyltransferase [Aequorivita echinoideorum]
MLIILIGFRKIKIFKAENKEANTTFSVVIPFRNEAENLPMLLKSISELNYPAHLFEVILINDESTDDSENIISTKIDKLDLNIKLIQNQRFSNSPKKDAITAAVKISKFEWILTTDADCKLPKNWLQSFNNFIRKNDAVFIAAPVIYLSNGSFLQHFQQLDGFSLQAATMGSFGFQNPIFCNGANLGYKKSAFFEVQGFAGNDKIASGDDMFMLEKMKLFFPNQLHFLKCEDAIVTTLPQKSWGDAINQRVRWASKTSKQENLVSQLLGIFVVLANLYILFTPVFILFQPENFGFYMVFFISKIGIDFLVLWVSSRFFNQKMKIFKTILSIFGYPVITLLVLFGTFRGKYNWKGRRFGK